MSAPATKIPGVKSQATAIGGALLTPTRSMHSKSYSMSDLTPNIDEEPVNKENIGDSKNRKKRNSISSRKRLSIGIATQGGTKSYRELKENEELFVAENTRLANELDDALESRQKFKTELEKANALVASYKKHVQEVEDDANAKITEVVTKSETEVKALQKEVSALKKRTAQMERKLKGLGIDVVSLQPIEKMAKDAEAHEARAQEFDGVLERMRIKLEKRKRDAANAQATHRSLADRIKAAITSAVPLFGTVTEEGPANESVNEDLSDSEFKDGADFLDSEQGPAESPKFVAKAFVAPQEIDSRRMTNMSFEDIERVLMEEELEEELRAQQEGQPCLAGVAEESANDEEDECNVNVLDAAMAQVREIAAHSTPSKPPHSPSPTKSPAKDDLSMDDPNVSQAISEIDSLLENDAIVPEDAVQCTEMQQPSAQDTAVCRSFSADVVTAEIEESFVVADTAVPIEEGAVPSETPVEDVEENQVDLSALENAMSLVKIVAATPTHPDEKEGSNEDQSSIAALGAEAESTESVSRLLEISAALCESKEDTAEATEIEDTADSGTTPSEEGNDELVMGVVRPRSPVMPTVLEDQTFRDDGTSASLMTGVDASAVDESFLRIEQVVMSIGSEPEEESIDEKKDSADPPASPAKDGYATAEEDGPASEETEKAEKDLRGRFEHLQVEVNDSFRALLEADITPIDIQPPSDDSAFDCGGEDEDRFEESVDHLPEHGDLSPKPGVKPDADSPASMTESILELERQLEEEIDILNEDEMYNGEEDAAEAKDDME